MQKIVSGIGSSTGRVRGKARIIKAKEDWSGFESGDILVTRITDPAMVPLMARAGAIVCDIGGVMSHPSIISRELGIPCVVNTKKATSVLRNGQLIEVDGQKGEVFLV